MPYTLKDVAKRAGVSTRTVGRVLNRRGPVSDDVAERVLEAAQVLHYVPNAAARNLKQRSSCFVGLITGSTYGCEAIQRRVCLLEEAVRAEERFALHGSLPATWAGLDALLREWSGLAQIVFFLTWNQEWNPAALRNYPMRFVFIDCASPTEEHDFLLTDRASGVENAVKALIDQGARRIAHVGRTTAAGRASGFEQAISHDTLSSIEAFTITTKGLELSDGYESGDELLKIHADAVFFDTDRMALGFYRYAHEHGIKIPGDILVAGFDNDSAGSFAIPTLTTVEHPDREIIEGAVAILSNPASSPVKKVLPTRLLERESTRKIPES